MAPLTSHTASGAASQDPPTPAPDDPAVCGAVLSRLSNAAAGLRYSISVEASGLAGKRGPSHFQATCSAGRVAVELAEEAGPAAGIHFSRDHGSSFALEIVGHYPDVGTVSQTAIIQGATTDTPRGSLTFAAETRDAAAFIEFNLAGDVVAEGGDAAVVNDQLAPVLTTSPTWKDAHTLTLALANTSDGVAEQPEAGLAVVLPVPNPRASGVKKSMVAMAMACGKSAVMCTLAATWLPPAITTCYGDSVACALTIGCAVVSCID